MPIGARLRQAARSLAPRSTRARVSRWSVAGYDIAAATDRGLARADNQDAYAVSPGPPLRVGVFDGVGGQPHGGAAARTAAASLPSCGPDVLRELDAAVAATGGATTAAVAEVSVGGATLSLMGDSRAYLLADGVRPLGLMHRTADGRLTQALGFQGTGQTVHTDLWAPLLLCTDGVRREAIQPVDGDLTAWAERLIDRVYHMGAPDNFTFVVLQRQ